MALPGRRLRQLHSAGSGLVWENAWALGRSCVRVPVTLLEVARIVYDSTVTVGRRVNRSQAQSSTRDRLDI